MVEGRKQGSRRRVGRAPRMRAPVVAGEGGTRVDAPERLRLPTSRQAVDLGVEPPPCVVQLLIGQRGIWVTSMTVDARSDLHGSFRRGAGGRSQTLKGP
jgi:hypothetical protein